MKKIELTRTAEDALTFLKPFEREKADQLLNSAAQNDFNQSFTRNSYKLTIPQKNIYALRLSEKLRIIIELFEDHIKVLDVINQGLYDLYFKNAPGQA